MGLNRNLGNLTEVIKEGSGLIGMGLTPAPGSQYKLDVVGSVRSKYAVNGSNISLQPDSPQVYLVASSSDSTYGDKKLVINSSGLSLRAMGTSTAAMEILSSGNVGIGTTTDAGYKLDVSGTGRFQGLLSGDVGVLSGINNSGSARGYSTNYQNNANSRSWKMVGEQIEYGDFAIQQSTTQTGSTYLNRLYINSIGNVGIGTNSPTLFSEYTTLAVNGTNGCALELKAGDVSGLRIFSDTGSSYLYENRNTALKFYTNGSLNAAMFPSGNMNIGTSLTDEGYKLYVDGYAAVKSGAYGGGGLIIKSYPSGASRNWGIFNDQLQFGDFCINTSTSQTGSPGTTRVYITPDGTTLFRRTTNLDPSYAAGFEGAIFFKCAVNGNNSVNFFNASTTYVASIVTNASSIVYGTGSDYRLKEDLKDFNGLEKISKIKVYDFKFIKEGDRMDGVLAHELQEVVPYAVTGEKDELDDKGNIKVQNVDYSKLTPILIKAIQELKAEIEILKQNK